VRGSGGENQQTTRKEFELKDVLYRKPILYMNLEMGPGLGLHVRLRVGPVGFIHRLRYTPAHGERSPRKSRPRRHGARSV
jgi:hypothetical protein